MRHLSFPCPMTPEQLQGLWKELNARYFQSKLPPIRILWSRRLTSSTGMFISREGPRAPRDSVRQEGGDHRLIRLSVPLLVQQPPSELVRTLAHEMIHQWQFDVRKRRPNHGVDFRGMMERINRDALGVSIHHSLNDRVLALSKYAWQCLRCGTRYRRHRRTIHPKRHRCSSCSGTLVEVADVTASVPPPPAGPAIVANQQAVPHRLTKPIQLSFQFD